MLAIARALMNSPELLLLDEPTEGLAPLIVRSLEEQILKLKEAGISILLSEQNVRSALRMITRAYVIDEGIIRFEGTVAELEPRRYKEKVPHGVTKTIYRSLVIGSIESLGQRPCGISIVLSSIDRTLARN
jgi:ABC-type lipopolysaccharide export system ATPase subunit